MIVPARSAKKTVSASTRMRAVTRMRAISVLVPWHLLASYHRISLTIPTHHPPQVILGAKFAEELHKEADPACLPRKLGGVLDDGCQWTKRSK